MERRIKMSAKEVVQLGWVMRSVNIYFDIMYYFSRVFRQLVPPIIILIFSIPN